MNTSILVTGGTGTLGRCVVPRLTDAGYAVRVLSRRPGEPTDGVRHVSADLSTGEGLAPALEGVDTVLHLAGGPKGDGEKARNLVSAIRASGATPHLVYISVVGVDRLPIASRFDRMAFGYYAEKRAGELAVEQSGLPWTTLRATQFHDLLLTTARAMARLPVVPVAGFRFQPVDTDEVAARLVELALGEPAGLVEELAGPRIHTMKEIVRSYLEASGTHRLTVPVRVPGRAARALRDGSNLAPDHAVGKRTWEEFLAEHVRR